MTVVTIWWAALSTVAVCNIAAWLLTARAVSRRAPGPAFAGQRVQLALSGVFVFGCAFRSFLPRVDVQRICLVDSWWSSVLVGRTVATVAELCFMAQLSLVLRAVSQEAGSRRAMAIAAAVVPLIAFAECWSWFGILTTNNLGHVIEESTWALTACLMVICVATLWGRLSQPQRRVAGPAAGLGGAYIAFMLLVDVPMYWARWIMDEAAHRAYLTPRQGLAEIATHWTVNFDPAIWRPEMPWMTLYFSLSVWASLLLVRADVRSQPDARSREPL